MPGTFITALVIESNDTVFIDNATGVIGTMQQIPTPGLGGQVDADYLALAVDEGYIGGFNYQVVSASFSPLPNPNAFHVVRISSLHTGDWWYVVGASYQYLAASAAAECCTTPAPMPSVIPPLYPCQIMCEQNTAGNFFGIFGLPSITAGQNYYAAGFFNNVTLTSLSAGGYSTIAALLAAMNTDWSNVGTWTDFGSPESIIVTEAPGTGTDQICILIFVH
jgi:hypothetical protein